MLPYSPQRLLIIFSPLYGSHILVDVERQKVNGPRRITLGKELFLRILKTKPVCYVIDNLSKSFLQQVSLYLIVRGLGWAKQQPEVNAKS